MERAALLRNEQRLGLSERRHVDEKELAQIIGVPVGTLRYWRLHRKGPKFAKLGRGVKYDLRDVEAWIAACTVETNETAGAR
jgi:hypothetical protein